jgi:Zn-finger nucleic acid-binding protein
MKCPHCFLELRLMLQYNKEIDQCPKCEGIWLDKDNSENIFDFTDDASDKNILQKNDFQIKEDTVDQNHDTKLENDYYYYKKPFKENGNLDDMFDFE